MNKISCDLCMDLMPLVRDVVASEDSATAVALHLKDCPSCSKLFEGQFSPPADSKDVLFHKLRSKGILYGAILVLLVLSLLLTSVMLTRYAEQKRDEQRYMRNLFSDIKNCSELAEYIGTVQGEPTEMYARLCYMLMDINESLEDGYNYVSDSVQSVSGWYFMESAANLTNSLAADGSISPETNAIAQSIHENLDFMLTQMIGPDGMNLNPEIDIREFSRIIFDFYHSLEPRLSKGELICKCM